MAEFRPGWLQRQVARSAALAARVPKALGGTGPRFVDRPASHAAAHAKGEPCACYPDRSNTGSEATPGGDA